MNTTIKEIDELNPLLLEDVVPYPSDDTDSCSSDRPMASSTPGPKPSSSSAAWGSFDDGQAEDDDDPISSSSAE